MGQKTFIPLLQTIDGLHMNEMYKCFIHVNARAKF